MIIYPKDRYEKCPVCGEDIIVQLDSDDLERIWIHQVFRSRECECEISISVGVDGRIYIQDTSSKPNEVELGY